jgi:NADH-quinone oxidoreductase subunit L
MSAAHAAVSAGPAVWFPQLLLIPGLPLAAFLSILLAGRNAGKGAGWIAVIALAGACGVALGVAPAVMAGARPGVSWAWLTQSDPAWTIGLAVDGLTLIMLLVVTVIGTMIACYSIGYMHEDPRVTWFFAYLSLFCASMLTLVLADHFALLFIGWELVGLCSYLLISFWFEKPAAAEAGRKAFLTTRVGDTGLLFGILILSTVPGGLSFAQFPAVAAQLPGQTLTLISLLIFLGAVGKSAQVPLHVWLPDAMEGPTPVSALIHAATMVAAGVYLVARAFPLFTPESLQIVLAIGLVTHLFAGTVALTQTDIKRILAYSTLSQLGLMVTALGIGARSAAMFHLMTHAWFKALLFLAAGSVIHAAHEQELSKLGGLRRAMPWTAGLFLFASLSMGGAMFLSGFWSKDAILLAARDTSPWLFWTLLAGAAMTAAYIFRLYFRCFEGAPHQGKHHAHEAPPIMVAPMAVLGIGAAFVGLVESPWFGHPFLRLLNDPHAHDHLDLPVAVLSTAALALGLALAWTVGFKRRNVVPAALRPLGASLYRLAYNKYYVDECYGRWIIRPFLAFTQWCYAVDQRVVDAAVNGAGRAGAALAEAKERVDRLVIDRIVNTVAATARGLGQFLRRLQTGVVQQYLLVVVVAVVVLSLAMGR